MSKPTLFLIHGMGNHTPESFKKQFNDTMYSVFKLYPSLSSQQFSKIVNVEAIGYNHHFENYRNNHAGNKDTFSTILESLPTKTLKNTFNQIINLQGSINDDEFFNSHWLDVLIYRFSTIGTNIQIDIANKIAEAIHAHSGYSQNVHMLSHSLGTAVLHDSLAKAYGEPSVDVPNPLNVVDHYLGSLHFVANTSRVLQSFIKVKDSRVKPGPEGCTRLYREYRHSLDPIARVKPFNPNGNGGWIGDYQWRKKHYQLQPLTSITNKHGNTHSIEHYLYNPKVHLKLIKEVAAITLPREEIEQAGMEYMSQTLKGVAEGAARAFKNISISDTATIVDYVKAYVALKTFVESLEGQLDV